MLHSRGRHQQIRNKKAAIAILFDSSKGIAGVGATSALRRTEE
jgi:hypothetical protein